LVLVIRLLLGRRLLLTVRRRGLCRLSLREKNDLGYVDRIRGLHEARLLVSPLVLAVFTAHDYRLTLEKILGKFHIVVLERGALVPDRLGFVAIAASRSDRERDELFAFLSVALDFALAPEASYYRDFSIVHCVPPMVTV